MNISENITQLRKIRGYSQEEIAQKLGISRQTYIKMENDEKNISVSQLEALSNIYGVTTEELMYNQQNLEKFKDMYLYILSKFTKHGVPKTKLAKLLYLCDFRHFYENLESISGVSYRCKTYGPLADAFLSLTDEMLDQGQIHMDYLSEGTNMITIQNKTYKPSFSTLSEDEKKEIDEICELWKNVSTQEIVNYTHEQKPWMACRDNEIIPYTLILQEEPDHVYTPIE